jgi:acyl-CoA reductase-like NAD-dependent aldehyde dehydrogenase
VATPGLLINNAWKHPASSTIHTVASPFSGAALGEVVIASESDVDSALEAAVAGAKLWRQTPAHQRAIILLEAARIADTRSEELARIISNEMGKSIREARGEASRAGEIIRLSAFEGAHRYGDSLPLDANAGTGFDKIGFTLAQPVGVVVAITPFNYPSLLVLHKVGPALAAGNAVILKPALTAPLTAIALTQCFLDAGLPPGVLGLLNGPGARLGEKLITDQRVNKVSFTGSTAVGDRITRIAGIKKLSLELGASSPVIVTKSADIEQAAHSITLGGYVNAGQVCIAAQRIIVDQAIEADFLAALTPRVQAITVGDPALDDTMVGTLISEAEAIRVEHAIQKVVADGAGLITGGQREGTILTPAIVRNVPGDHPFAQEELFGPAVSVTTAENFEDALRLANSTEYGLGAGVFTHDQDESIRAMRDIDSGIVHINWTPLWRADLMPYGGMKSSGIGKEGVRAAVNEMTDWKTVILHSRVQS